MIENNERRKFFRDIFSRNRKAIIEKWISHMRLREEYALRPGKELDKSISSALQGKEAFLCDQNTAPLDEYIKRASVKRLGEGFPLSAVLHAIDGFRVVMTSLIIKEADQGKMEGLFTDINGVIGYCQRELTNEYQILAMAKLNEKVDELKHAVDVRDNFFSNVSHEFRTPLTVIQGFSKILENGKTPPQETANLARKIHEAGETLFRMISDLILMSKLKGNTAKAGNSHIYLNELAEKAQQEAMRWIYDDRHNWEKNYMDSDPMVIGDYEMFKAMLAHIMSNAMKFSPKTSKIIVVTRVDKDFSYVDLIDEGIGIEKKDIDFLFENFSQKESHLSRNFEGSGIGLHLARQIAWLHGGDIMAEKRTDAQGSVFTLSLPLAERLATS